MGSVLPIHVHHTPTPNRALHHCGHPIVSGGSFCPTLVSRPRNGQLSGDTRIFWVRVSPPDGRGRRSTDHFERFGTPLGARAGISPTTGAIPISADPVYHGHEPAT